MTDPICIVREVHAKDCPFCGRSDIITVKSPGGHWVTICWPDADGCGARTDYRYSSAAALIAWNRRPT